MRTALVTGAAGFIGFHLARLLLQQGWRVVGVDSHNDYYDPALKAAREAQLVGDYRGVRGKVETPGLLGALIAEERPEAVIHLAAQAGVRHSIHYPDEYVRANLLGVFEMLEACRDHPPKHLLMASSSSVYGANTAMPYREIDKADTQLSFYGATKKANEAMAHSYAHLFRVPITMFRFFTVYGPWGRPDMAPFLFTDAVLSDQPIKVFNHGDMQRDFTYVADLVDALARLIETPPATESLGEFDSLSPTAPFRVVNIGNGAPVALMDFVAAIEAATGRTAVKDFQPMQPGDVPATWADTTLLKALIGPMSHTSLQEGVGQFVRWFKDYYGK